MDPAAYDEREEAGPAQVKLPRPTQTPTTSTKVWVDSSID